MGREEIKQGLRENGEQGSVEPAADAKTIGPHQTEKQDKAEEPRSETPENLRELASEPGDLLDSYGETRAVLLPVEPYLLHVYWEVTSVELEKAKDQLGDEYGRSQAILRCYDVTNIIFEGTNAHSSFDVHIDLKAKNRYVNLWSPEKSYFVELGFKTEGGRFFPIARSNIAEIPPGWPAPKTDEYYMLVAGDYDLVEAVPTPVDGQPHKIAPRFYTSRLRRSRREIPIASSYEKGSDFDLTEMSEKRFTFGLSSG